MKKELGLRVRVELRRKFARRPGHARVERRVARLPGRSAVGTFPVTLAVPGPIPLEGQTLNYSDNGVLVIAHGKIPVFVGIRGKHYRGLLFRADSVNDKTTAYAIELLDPLEI